MSMTSRSAEQWQPLFDGITKLRSTWPARGWSWDGRLSCVTSSFSTEFETKARESAATALPQEWTSTTLLKAPAHVRELAERHGGLRSGQLLLLGGPFGGILAFGLWWPWGDGVTISLRVGLADLDIHREPFPKFREGFGVTL